MPWKVSTGVAGCDGFAVVKKDTGKLVACHKDRGKADAQVRALYANEAQTAAAVGALARELLEEGGALVARGELMEYRGKTMSRTEAGVRMDEAERNVPRRPFREELHPRHPKGTPVGGQFTVSTNAAGRYEVVNPDGAKVAEMTEPEAADEFAALANARETKVPIPTGTSGTVEEIPNAWAVEQGYATWVDSPFGESTFYGAKRNPTTPGSIRWNPDVDPEVVLVHYLSGTPPTNFPQGSQGWEQWTYGRNPRATPKQMPGQYGTRYQAASDKRAKSAARRAAMAKIKRPGNKEERAALLRRLTSAIAAAGFVVAGDEPDEALVASIRADFIERDRASDNDFALFHEVLTAAVTIPTSPPGRWFGDPGLDRPTPLTVTADGQVFGHLALWDSCHIGEPGGQGVCVAPPRSSTGYSLFHLGEVETAEGELVPVGKITLGTGHASLQASRNAAASHYDNTGSVVADVRAGEDRHGIWVSGSLRPGLDELKVRELRAAGISGDWRRYRNALELVAALAVNVPGFPIPRVAALVAPELDGDERMSLVAAGSIFEPVPMTALEVNARIDALGLLAGVADF